MNAAAAAVTLSPEVILNSQISPTMMCQPSNVTVETGLVPPSMMPTNQTAVSPLHSPNPLLVAATEPEKVVLLKAAVDLLETQKTLCELTGARKAVETIDILPRNNMGQLQGNNFTTSAPPLMTTSISGDTPKSNFIIPVPVKEMAGADKKNDDRMIPQAFTSLTENELINLINPSCFDQGNNTGSFQ